MQLVFSRQLQLSLMYSSAQLHTCMHWWHDGMHSQQNISIKFTSIALQGFNWVALVTAIE